MRLQKKQQPCQSARACAIALRCEIYPHRPVEQLLKPALDIAKVRVQYLGTNLKVDKTRDFEHSQLCTKIENHNDTKIKLGAHGSRKANTCMSNTLGGQATSQTETCEVALQNKQSRVLVGNCPTSLAVVRCFPCRSRSHASYRACK